MDKDENQYQKLVDLLDNNSVHLKQLALLLNKNRKNKEFIHNASNELGRNASHIGRAVRYFPFAFGEETDSAYAYHILFMYARLKRELAVNLYNALGTTLSLYDASKAVEAAKPRRKRKESLARRVAVHIKAIDNYDKFGAAIVIENICKEPEIAREI